MFSSVFDLILKAGEAISYISSYSGCIQNDGFSSSAFSKVESSVPFTIRMLERDFQTKIKGSYQRIKTIIDAWS